VNPTVRRGNPGYHPKMHLKVMVYSYRTNVYSSRRIELALRENIKLKKKIICMPDVPENEQNPPKQTDNRSRI